MGAAAVIRNFPLEFKIADKKDEIDINSKKGKVILLRSTARSNFPFMFLKPGEIRNKNSVAKISIMKIIKRIKITNKFNIWFAK
jgi:hypothetical protein